jgi:hypothetical protein
MRVKIIANHPNAGQASIECLIGQTFEGTFCGDTNEVTVHSDKFSGSIVLNKNEYKQVKEKQNEK